MSQKIDLDTDWNCCTTASRHARDADLPLAVLVSDADTMLSLTRSRRVMMHDMPSAWHNVHVDEIVV